MIISSPALTLFTTMKPFCGETARVQRNSIKSWLALTPRPEIIVFGNDTGVREACQEFGLRFVPEVERAQSGLPYLDDLFTRAQRLATSHVLCYVNADIMLTSDLLRALDLVSGHLGPAVMVCAPHNLVIGRDIDISDSCWEPDMRADAARNAVPPTTKGADLFVFPSGFFRNLPRLTVGHCWWDNALLWAACSGSLPALDLTDAVLAVHQHHHQTTHLAPSGYGEAQIDPNPEWERNRARTRWWQRNCWRVDLPLALRPDGSIMRRTSIPRGALLRAVTARQCASLRIDVLNQTFYIRRRLGLYRWWPHKDTSERIHKQYRWIPPMPPTERRD